MPRLHRTPFQRFIAALAANGWTFPSRQALAQVCVNQGVPAPLEICVKNTREPGVWVMQPNGRTRKQQTNARALSDTSDSRFLDVGSGFAISRENARCD